MNNKSYLLTYILILIGGVALIMMNGREKLFEVIAIVVGIVFMVLGLMSGISGMNLSQSARQAGKRPNVPVVVVSVGALALGLIMVIAPGFFINYLVYAIGVGLILGGALQVYSLATAMKSVGLSGYFLSAPIVSIIAGVIIMVLGPDKVLSFLALLTGIILVVFSLNGIVGYIAASRNLKDGSKMINIK